jgi:hypothetical protein
MAAALHAQLLNVLYLLVIKCSMDIKVDPAPGDAVTKQSNKKVFAACHEKYCSINGAPIRRLMDEGMRKERYAGPS